jgi:hypothetical protein
MTSGKWDSISETLKALIEEKVPEEIVDQWEADEHRKALADAMQDSGPELLKDKVRKSVDAKKRIARSSQASKDLRTELNGLDVLVLSNLPMGTDDREEEIKGFAHMMGVKEVRFFYKSPLPHPQPIPFSIEKDVAGEKKALRALYVAGNVDLGHLEARMSTNPNILLFSDRVLLGLYDPMVYNSVNKKNYADIPEDVLAFLASKKNLNTIATPAYARIGQSRKMARTDGFQVDVVNCGPSYNCTEGGQKCVPIDAEVLDTVVFMHTDMQGNIQYARSMLIDKLSMLTWGDVLADKPAEKPRKKPTERRTVKPVPLPSPPTETRPTPAPQPIEAEQEESLADRAKYLAALHKLDMKNPTIEGVRDLFPHLSNSHIEDIITGGNTVVVTLPSVRLKNYFHYIRFIPQTIDDQGTEKEKTHPPRIEYMGAGTTKVKHGQTRKITQLREEDPFLYKNEAIDFATHNWGESLSEPGNHSIVALILEDKEGNKGKPGFPKESRLTFVTNRPWKEIIGDAKNPLSKLSDEDIDQEGFDAYCYHELNLGYKEHLKLKMSIEHYDKLPPSIVGRLNIVPKPKALPAVPIKPAEKPEVEPREEEPAVLKDPEPAPTPVPAEKPVPSAAPAKPAVPSIGDAKTKPRPAPVPEKKPKRPTASTKPMPVRKDADMDPMKAGTAEILPDDESSDDIFKGVREASDYVTNPENLEAFIRFIRLTQYAKREEVPDDMIDRLIDPTLFGLLGLISRNAQEKGKMSRLMALQDKLVDLYKVHPKMFDTMLAGQVKPLEEQIKGLKEELGKAEVIKGEHVEERRRLEEKLSWAELNKTNATKQHEIDTGKLQTEIDEHKDNLETISGQKNTAEWRGKRDRHAARLALYIIFGGAVALAIYADRYLDLKDVSNKQSTKITFLEDQKLKSRSEIDRLQQKIEEMKGTVVGGEGEVSDAVNYLAAYIAEVKVALNNTATGSIDVPKLDYKGKIALVEKIYNIVIDFNGRVDDLSRRLEKQINDHGAYREETKTKLDELGQQLTEAKKAGVNLEGSLRKTETERDDYKQQVEDYKKRVDELVERTTKLEEEVKKIPGLEERLEKVQGERDNLEKSKDEALRRQNEAEEARKAANARVEPLDKKVAELNKTLEDTLAKYKTLAETVAKKEKECNAIVQDYETKMAELKRNASEALTVFMRTMRSRVVRLPSSIGDMITPEMDRLYFNGILGKVYGEFDGVRLYTIKKKEGEKEKEIPFVEVRKTKDGEPHASFEDISEDMLTRVMRGVTRARTAIETSHRMQVKAAYRLFMYDYFTKNKEAQAFAGTFGDILTYLRNTVQNERINVREIMTNSLGYKGYTENDRVPIQRPKSLVFDGNK